MKKVKVSLLILLLMATLLNSRVYSQRETEKTRGFLVDSQPQGAIVHIENEVIGTTPCWFPYELAGRYRIWAEKRGYENWSRRLEFGNRPLSSLRFSLTAKNRSRATWRSMLIPGWGQFYSERKTKGKAFLTLQLAALVTLGFAQSTYGSRQDDYDHSLEEYQRLNGSPTSQPYAWRELTHAEKELDSARRVRNVLLYSVAAIYAANVLDAFFLFPHNLRQIEILGRPLQKVEVSFGQNRITLSWTL